MIDWRELDEAILHAIDRDCIRTFTAIAHRVEDLAKPHAKRTRSPFPTPPWRIVDRRLQAMRKLGIVEFRGKEWHLARSLSV